MQPSAEPRRPSLERLRSVGQSFANNFVALGERVSSISARAANPLFDPDKSPPPDSIFASSFQSTTDQAKPQPQPELQRPPQTQRQLQLELQQQQAQTPPQQPAFGATAPPLLETGVLDLDSNPSAVELEREVERLRNILFATERRLEALQNEASTLRATNRSLATSNERTNRSLEALRREFDANRNALDDNQRRVHAADAEVARLRADGIELDRETKRARESADEAARNAAEERARAAALERVMMGLRRRVAVAEERGVSADRLHDAVVAREKSEAALVDARAEAERQRARAVGIDVVKERALVAERAERSLREKVVVLRRDVDSRDELLKQAAAERAKFREFMATYEKTIIEKDAKLSKLRRIIRNNRGVEAVLPAVDDSLNSAIESSRDLNASEPSPEVPPSDASSEREPPRLPRKVARESRWGREAEPKSRWGRGDERDARWGHTGESDARWGREDESEELWSRGDEREDDSVTHEVSSGVQQLSVSGQDDEFDLNTAVNLGRLAEASPILRNVEQVAGQIRSMVDTPVMEDEDVGRNLVEQVREVEKTFGAMNKKRLARAKLV